MKYSVFIQQEQATDGSPIWVSRSELKDLQGDPATTHGDSIGEAIMMAEDLERLWIEIYEERHIPLPPVPEWRETGIIAILLYPRIEM